MTNKELIPGKLYKINHKPNENGQRHVAVKRNKSDAEWNYLRPGEIIMWLGEGCWCKDPESPVFEFLDKNGEVCFFCVGNTFSFLAEKLVRV